MPYDAIDPWRSQVARRSRAARWLGSLALLAASMLAGLLLLELCSRLLRGPDTLADFRNLVLASRRVTSEAINRGPPSYEYDATLGFFNRPNYSSQTLSIDAEGFRTMPPLAPGAVAAPPILATGDSYTKGDDARDDESWPARVQEQLAWRTVNAGVSAYGLDQTVLLSERLVRQSKPAVLVLGFIADDVRRTELSRAWGRNKPFFELAGGQLALRNVPVPPDDGQGLRLTFLQRAFGWSVLLDTVLDRLQLRERWHVDETRALPEGTGERLACPLMRRVAALGVPTLVVAQYLPSAWQHPSYGAEEHREARLVLDCAAAAGLATLDLYGPLGDAVRAGGRDAVYAHWHPNRNGYRLIGDSIAAELRRRKLLGEAK